MEAYSSSQLFQFQIPALHYEGIHRLFTEKLTEFKNYERAMVSVVSKLITLSGEQLAYLHDEYEKKANDRNTKLEFRKFSHTAIAKLIEHIKGLDAREKEIFGKSNQVILEGQVVEFASGKVISEGDPKRIAELTKLTKVFLLYDEFDIAEVVISEVVSKEVKDELLDLLKTFTKSPIDFAVYTMKMKFATELFQNFNAAKKFLWTKLKLLSLNELDDLKTQSSTYSEERQPALNTIVKATYKELMIELLSEIISRKRLLIKITNYLQKGEEKEALNLADIMKREDKFTIKIYTMIFEHCKNKQLYAQSAEVFRHMPECPEKNELQTKNTNS